MIESHYFLFEFVDILRDSIVLSVDESKHVASVFLL